MNSNIEIVHASTDHAEEVAPLFDTYRCWSGQESDLGGALSFIRQRLSSSQSEIFFIRRHNQTVAFTQLYPMFSSMSLARIWIINDLYVVESARRTGLGTVLLETAVEFARALGAVRIRLETKHNNATARAAFEALGWQQDRDFLHYQLDLAESDVLKSS